MGAERWPCGHPKHPRNTVSIGDGRVRCGICRAATCAKSRSRTPSGRYQRERAMTRIDAERIILGVVAETGVPLADIVGDDRSRRVAGARHRAYAELNKAGASKVRIAELMLCSHSSVIYGIRRAAGHSVAEAH